MHDFHFFCHRFHLINVPVNFLGIFRCSLKTASLIYFNFHCVNIVLQCTDHKIKASALVLSLYDQWPCACILRILSTLTQQHRMILHTYLIIASIVARRKTHRRMTQNLLDYNLLPVGLYWKMFSSQARTIPND